MDIHKNATMTIKEKLKQELTNRLSNDFHNLFLYKDSKSEDVYQSGNFRISGNIFIGNEQNYVTHKDQEERYKFDPNRIKFTHIFFQDEIGFDLCLLSEEVHGEGGVYDRYLNGVTFSTQGRLDATCSCNDPEGKDCRVEVRFIPNCYLDMTDYAPVD